MKIDLNYRSNFEAFQTLSPNYIPSYKPVLDIGCPNCSSGFRYPLLDGVHYETPEVDKLREYIEDMRFFILEATEGKVDITQSYNEYLLNQINIKIEIEKIIRG